MEKQMLRKKQVLRWRNRYSDGETGDREETDAQMEKQVLRWRNRCLD
jgi:hypothetical protein